MGSIIELYRETAERMTGRPCAKAVIKISLDVASRGALVQVWPNAGTDGWWWVPYYEVMLWRSIR